MIGAAFGRRKGSGLAGVGAADNGKVFAKRRERLQGIGELEIGALLRGAPIVATGAIIGAARRAMYHFNTRQAGSGRCRRFAQGGLRGHHGIQKRQGQGYADSAEYGAARNVLLCKEHVRGVDQIIVRIWRRAAVTKGKWRAT